MGILDKIIQVDKYNNIGLLGMTDEFFCAYINKMFKGCKLFYTASLIYLFLLSSLLLLM